MNGWMNEWMNEWMGGQMDRYRDGRALEIGIEIHVLELERVLNIPFLYLNWG